MGLGIAEIAVILVVALLVIGPDKLPDVAKSVGKGYGEFKRAFNEFKRTVDINADATLNERSAPAQDKQIFKSKWEAEALKNLNIEEKKADASFAEEPKDAPRAKRSSVMEEE